jgi:hypothetical protein
MVVVRVDGEAHESSSVREHDELQDAVREPKPGAAFMEHLLLRMERGGDEKNGKKTSHDGLREMIQPSRPCRAIVSF